MSALVRTTRWRRSLARGARGACVGAVLVASSACGSRVGDSQGGVGERVGTVQSALTFTATCSPAYALSGGTVAVSGGSGTYSACAFGTNTSGGTCNVAGGVATYTAGATAGYYIVAQRTATNGTPTGGSYLQRVGAAYYLQTGGAAGVGSLWLMAQSGTGFTFNLAGAGNDYLRTLGVNSPDMVADQAAAGAAVFNMTDCNGTGDPGYYNRFGFQSPTGTNPYWKDNASPQIDSVNAGNGTNCDKTNNSAWEAFYLVPGSDVFTVTDSAGNTGTCTIAVENPVSIQPSTISVSAGGSIPAAVNGINAVQAWGGSGVFTGGVAGCTVVTNNTMSSPATCTVTGSGAVSYTVGNSSGTDTLRITDSQGNTATFTVSGGLHFVPSPSVAAKSSAMTPVTVSGGNGTYSSCTVTVHPSGGTTCSVTGTTVSYTAGPTAGTTDTLTVKDSAGHTGTFNVIVENPLAFAPSPSPAIVSTAMSPVTVSGGSGTYSTCVVATNVSGSSGGCTVTGTTVTYTPGATSGTDVLKVTDSNGLTGSLNVTVEAALGFTPSPSTALVSTAMTPVTVSGGSGTYSACAVTTNASGGGACAVVGTTVTYTAGATAGTDTLQITDSQGHTGTFSVTVEGMLAFSPSPAGAAKLTAMTPVTVTGGSGTYTTCAVTVNTSGGGACTVTGSTVTYTAGAAVGTDTLKVTDSMGHTGTFTVIVEATAVTCAARYTLASAAMPAVTVTGGSGVYSSCTILTNTSGGTTCAVTAGGAVSYTAGATAGYYIVPQGTATNNTPTGGTYLRSFATGCCNYVEPGGGAGLSSLWVMAPSGTDFTFHLASNGQYMYESSGTESSGNDLLANTNAGGADTYTMTDCNGSGDTGYYNRFGFASSAGANPYWQLQNPTTPHGYVYDVGAGGGSNCSQTSGSTQEAFYLIAGGDVLVVKDSLGQPGTCTVTVENPVATAPTSIALATSTAIPAQAAGVNAVQAWGGSGVFTEAGACTVMTNASLSAGTCTVTGSGQVGYTAGATPGTDVLKITDTQGHSTTVNVIVAGNLVSVGFGINPPQILSPKATAVFTTNGAGTGALTWALASNNSGGSIVPSTGQYTAGATGNSSDLVQVTDSAGDTATVVVSIGPSVSITPSPATVRQSTAMTFTASGGSGTFSGGSAGCALTTNGSVSAGCTVTAGGTVSYTSGATAGTDVLRVTDSLGNTGTVTITVSCGADPSLQILYPYNKTVFPLGMLPPLIQWKDNGTATYAKVTLQYPTTGAPVFTWSEIVRENGALSTPYNLLPTALPVTGGGRAQIPPLVWTTLQSAAAGSDFSIQVQTLESNQGTLPATITTHFATGQLKGTIYYQSYDTNLVTHGAATPTGAVLGITVGSPTPSLVDGNATTCRSCHSVAASGNRLVVNDNGAGDDGLYGGSNVVSLPSNVETAISPGAGTTPNDGRFSWPAVSPDGTMMFTNEGNLPVWMSGNWGTTTAAYGGVASGSSVTTLSSGLYSLPGGAALTTVGLAAGFQGKFPTWATDTSALAFNYASSDSVSLAMMSVSAGPTYTFSTPTVLFTPPTPPATYPNNSGAAEWPSFMPAGQNGIVFQNRVAYDCQEPGADGAAGGSNLGSGSSEMQGNVGALGELWWVNTTGTPLPQRLANANGVGYLPQGPNGHGLALSTVGSGGITCSGVNLSVTPAAPGCGAANPTDSAGGIPTYAQLSNANCGNGTCLSTTSCLNEDRVAIGNGNDTLENFKPTVNPQVTGGYQWVVFMSRRMYGNVATLNPYASNPRTTTEIRNTASPQYPDSKKLWVAAINASPTPGTDPSYPAFYLDGQELYAGNSRSYWVLPQCIVPSSTRSTATVCTSNQDCCTSGTGTPASCTLDIPIATNPPTKHCVPNTAIMCSADGAACNVDGDCCNLVSEGARCSGGTCQVPPVAGYPAAATVAYDFQGVCTGGVVVVTGDASATMGQAPIWEFVQSDQTVPTGTSITITLQTATTEAGLSTATMTPSYSISSTVTLPSYLSSPQVGSPSVAETVDQYLKANNLASQTWLRVNVTLNSSSNRMSAPTLTSLEPTFDCAATE
jgi:hypothetical protein